MPGTYNKSGVDVLYYSNEVIVTTVNVTSTTILLLPANPNRQGLTIYNPAANSVYLKYDKITNGDTRRIPNDSTFDMIGTLVYTGAIYAKRNGSATGNIIITEYI